MYNIILIKIYLGTNTNTTMDIIFFDFFVNCTNNVQTWLSFTVIIISHNRAYGIACIKRNIFYISKIQFNIIVFL